MTTKTIPFEREITWLWTLALLGVGLFAILSAVLPWFVSTSSPSRIFEVFLLDRQSSCMPKPLEQARFLLFCVLSIGASFLVAWTVRNQSSVLLRIPQSYSHFLTWITQVSILILTFQAWNNPNDIGFEYVSSVALAVSCVLTVFFLFDISLGKKSKVSKWMRLSTVNEGKMHFQVAPHLLAFLIALTAVSSCYFSEDTIIHSFLTVRDHLPFTMGEFAAVFQGKTPYVDFFPQYQNCLPLLFVPIFKVIGFNIGTFTGVMAVLNFMISMTIFYALKQFTERPWVALFLYVPVLAIGFYSIEVQMLTPLLNADFERNHAFNYYAAYPLRGISIFGTLYLLLQWMNRPSRTHEIILFVGAGILALNNLDFGIPSYFAMCVAYWLFSMSSTLRVPHLIQTIAKALGGVTVAAALFVCWVFLRSGGQYPHFSQIFEFQRVFALYGFMMLPSPQFGPHWMIFGTYTAGVLTAFYMGLRAIQTQKMAISHSRLQAAILAFSSIAGIGTGTYFMGRSHPWVLCVLFLNWGFVAILLFWLSLGRILEVYQRTRFDWVPVAVLSFYFFLFWTQVSMLANPFHIFERLNSKDSSLRSIIDQEAAFVQHSAAPEEPVLIFYPFSELIAIRAGIRDVNPFSHPGSLVVREQMGVLIEAIRKNQVHKVFGYLADQLGEHYYPPELTEALKLEGFKLTHSIPQDDGRWRQVGMLDFELWTK